jgi:hypothetical protein
MSYIQTCGSAQVASHRPAKHLVELGSRLARIGVSPAASFRAIDDALDRLTSGRSQQWSNAAESRDKARQAYAEQAAALAEDRARRAATSIFSRLPKDAVLDDFAAALIAREPRISAAFALQLAHMVAASFATLPVVQRGPAPGANPFAEVRVEPSAADHVRHNRALKMLGKI